MGTVGTVEIERRKQRLSLLPLYIEQGKEQEEQGNWPHMFVIGKQICIRF